MAEDVDTGLALLQHKVSDQRFVLAILGLHVYKRNLSVNGTETFDLNSDWPTDFSLNCFLGGSFHLDLGHSLQRSESISPSAWQHHERRAGINQGITSDALRIVSDIVDSYGGNDSSHILILDASRTPVCGL